jgi:riboflavin biosynthesis pyrimidine reductase
VPEAPAGLPEALVAGSPEEPLDEYDTPSERNSPGARARLHHMRQLFPVAGAAPGAPRPVAGGTERAPADGAADAADLEALADVYAYPEPDPVAARPEVWLRANMVAGLDGAGQHGGRSQPLSGAADMRIFGVLRALADVVLVGAQTVRQEGYRPARARRAFADRRAAAGQSPAPAIAVVTAGLDLDFSAPLFTEPLVPTLVLTGADAPAGRVAAARRAGAEVLFAGDAMGVEPKRVLDVLAARGLHRLLLEGGPRLLGQFVAECVLDELCLTLAPVLTAGSAQRIAHGPEVPAVDRMKLVSVLEENGFLFLRYRR